MIPEYFGELGLCYGAMLKDNISAADFVGQVVEGGLLPFMENLFVLIFDGEIYQPIAWVDLEVINDLYNFENGDLG